MPCRHRTILSVVPLLALSLALSLSSLVHGQQLTPDQQAALLLASARKAYNEKNIPFAVDRFKEYLAKFGNQKDVPAARYGLALAYLELPEKNYQGAIEQLKPLASVKDFPEAALVAYYLGLSHRGLGVRETAQAAAKPNEAPTRLANARKHFEDALKDFTTAVTAFKSKLKPPPDNANQLPADHEWYARAVCDECEMLMRIGKTREARDAVVPVAITPLYVKSRYRGLGLYYHAFTNFLLKEFEAASKDLNQLTPFIDPIYGPHARYLLARTHHVANAHVDAARLYDAVLADYSKQKQVATLALQNPNQFKDDLDEKARLEAFVKTAPDYVARASFSLGVLLSEDGKFADALARFTAFPKDYPTSPLLLEAQLQQGFCQARLGQFAEVPKTLQPVADREPRLADQALYWIAKAHVSAANPANAQAYQQTLTQAIATLRQAADRAQQMSASDPEAKARKGEILLELADVQQLAKQFRDAANTCNQVLTEKLVPSRDDELLQRQIAALHLAGDFDGSDGLVQRFLKEQPKSPLTAPVLFRHAENAYFKAAAADKNPNLPNRSQELPKLYDEAAKRYLLLVDKYPEFPRMPLARLGLGMSLYHKGDLARTRAVLEEVPAAQRTGELALVSYILADCLIRQAPDNADAVDALKSAGGLLDGFLSANSTRPEAGDALLKLGLCQQRLAATKSQPAERSQLLATARAAYERLLQQFPKHDAAPQAIFERAKCMAQSGDQNGSVAELKRFLADPLKASPVAPMAVLHLATLLRTQNKSDEAAAALGVVRPIHEANLLKDPAKAEWVPLLQYHHAVALREAGKHAEARAIFQTLSTQFASRPEGPDASLRLGQSLLDEGIHKVESAQKRLAVPNVKLDEINAANNQMNEGLNSIRAAAQHLESQAEQMKNRKPEPEVRARMLYDAAWAHRWLAEPEIIAARKTVVEAQKKKWLDELTKKNPGIKAPAIVPEPLITPAMIPLQPSEQKTRHDYQTLIAAFPTMPIASEARFELAELMAERAELEPAIKLLKEALEKPPSPELADKIRIRLGVCLFARGDLKDALLELDRVADTKSPLAGHAHYRAGECLMQQGDWAKAATRFAVFRDQPPMQNIIGLSDKALLRLGHAYANAKQWEQSRQAHELLVSRFSNSAWRNDALYGAGWAAQNLGQYDAAVALYQKVVDATATEVAAKAQLQIGLCRMQQKQYAEATSALLIVPFTYDYPDHSAIALCEAGRAFAEMKQPEQARRLFERVLKDHPDSKWAEVARERLAAVR
jgi:TolA-binding protein